MTAALLLSVPEVCTRLRCSRTKVFELLRYGRLARAERLGRETMITTASVERLERERVAPPEPERVAKPRRSRPATGYDGMLQRLTATVGR